MKDYFTNKYKKLTNMTLTERLNFFNEIIENASHFTKVFKINTDVLTHMSNEEKTLLSLALEHKILEIKKFFCSTNNKKDKNIFLRVSEISQKIYDSRLN